MRKKLWCRGSLSVEACFVVPITLGVIFCILYILFMFHDQIILQRNVYLTLYQVKDKKIDPTNKECKPILKDKLWFVKIEDIEIHKGITKIDGTVKTKSEFDVPVITWFMKKEQMQEVKAQINITHPEQIRQWKEENKDGDKK